MVMSVIMLLTEVTAQQQPAGSNDDSLILIAIIITAFCFICSALSNSSDSDAKKRREKEKYLEELKIVRETAKPYRNTAFVGNLAKRIQKNRNDQKISRIEVKTDSAVITFEKNPEENTVTSIAVYFSTDDDGMLKKENCIPAACALVFELGNSFRVLFQENKPTAVLIPNTVIL